MGKRKHLNWNSRRQARDSGLDSYEYLYEAVTLTFITLESRALIEFVWIKNGTLLHKVALVTPWTVQRNTEYFSISGEENGIADIL